MLTLPTKNNSVTQCTNIYFYLEHTRHAFCRHAGFSFGQMQQRGIIPVLNRVEIEYKTPLRSGDTMVSSLWIEMQGVRFIFHQDIFNKETGRQAVAAVVSCVCLENGKLSRGEAIAEAFKQYL